VAPLLASPGASGAGCAGVVGLGETGAGVFGAVGAPL
jgi:hypothetical protein